MQIKPIARLEPSDLPFAESPDLAVRFVARLRSKPTRSQLRYDPSDIPGFLAFSGPEVAEVRLIKGLERGDLILVFGPGDSRGPIAPLAIWRRDSDSSAVGSWKSGIVGYTPPTLSPLLDRLNLAGETPRSSIQARQGAGFNHSSYSTDEVVPPKNKQTPAEHKLALGLGAAPGITSLAMGGRRSEGAPSKPLRLRVGIFLDGTLNNINNIEIFKRKLESECAVAMRKGAAELKACRNRLRLIMGESYAGDPTNVIKLFGLYREESRERVDAFEHSTKVYQGGVGTTDRADDSGWGMATGLGETGITAQVEKAFSRLSERIYELVSGAQIDQLTIDIFGFSRGAAASRYAANEIVRAKEGALGEFFRAKQIAWPSSVSIGFMGLFDTVAGIINPLLLDVSAGNGRNYPVKLDVDPASIRALVHLVAQDERRANFALSSVRSGSEGLPSRFREISLPGAHSDIGGGYPLTQEEMLLLHPTVDVSGSDTKWPRQTSEWDNIQELMQRKTDEGWIGNHSLPLSEGKSPKLFVEEKRSEHPAPDGRIEWSLRMRRAVRGEYSLVSFRLMHLLSREEGVPFDNIPAAAEYALPDELEPIYASFVDQVASGKNELHLPAADQALLKQRYVHHSDHFNAMDFLLFNLKVKHEFPFQLFHPLRPQASKNRTVFYNSP